VGTTFINPQPLRTPEETSSDSATLLLTPSHSTYNPRLLRVQRLRDFAKRKLRAQVSTRNLFALLMKHFRTSRHNPRLLRVQRFRYLSSFFSLLTPPLNRDFSKQNPLLFHLTKMSLVMSAWEPLQPGVIWSEEGTGVEKSFSILKIHHYTFSINL